MKNDRLTLMREKAGITQGELANRIGVTQSAIAYYESGKREPSVQVAIKIAQYFGVSVEWLFFANKNDNSSYKVATA